MAKCEFLSRDEIIYQIKNNIKTISFDESLYKMKRNFLLILLRIKIKNNYGYARFVYYKKQKVNNLDKFKTCDYYLSPNNFPKKTYKFF